jgi:hypothetical protein
MIPLDEDILFIGWFNQQPVLPTKDEWEFYLCIILQHLTSSFEIVIVLSNHIERMRENRSSIFCGMNICHTNLPEVCFQFQGVN